jgi:hypothetical protein
MKIVLYERPPGEYHFSSPGQTVEADLKDGYRVAEGRYGELLVFGERGVAGMTLEHAMNMGIVVRLPNSADTRRRG